MFDEEKTEVQKTIEKFSLKDGLSINEVKVSCIVCAFIITLIFTLYTYHSKGDFSDNLLYLLQSMLLVIGGVNITNQVSEIFSKRRKC